MSGFQQFRRYLSYIFIGLLSVTVVLAGGGAFYLWAWTLKSAPNFHESWTSEEREAITEFDTYLRCRYADDLLRSRERLGVCGWEVSELGLFEQLAVAYCARNIAAPVSDMLHEAAESGNAACSSSVSFLGMHGITPAILAAQTAHLKALEALVRHGDSPNAIAYYKQDEYTDAIEAETPLSPLLNGLCVHERRLPWEERRATAEVLLKLGADINVTHRMHGLSCDMPLLLRSPEADAPWQWALDHGMKMKASNFFAIICQPAARALVERVLREKLVDINSVEGEATILQSMLKKLLHPYDDRISDEEWEARFDMLLAAGADPNLVPPKREMLSSAESTVSVIDDSQESPLEIVGKALNAAETPARRELCRRVQDKLRAAGARSTSTD